MSEMKQIPIPAKWSEDRKRKSFELVRRNKTVNHLVAPHMRPFYKMWKDPEILEFGVYSSRKVGKSFHLLMFLYEHCWNNEDQICRFVLPSLKSAKEIVVPMLGELRHMIPKEFCPKHMKSENSLVFERTGSIIKMGGVNDIQAVEGLRGPKSELIVADEIAAWNNSLYEYALESVLLPQMTTVENAKFVCATTPPSSPAHAFISGTENKKSLYIKLLEQNRMHTLTIHDNTLLSPSQIQKIIDRYGGEDDPNFRREYLCELIADENLMVTPEFNKEKHVVENVWEGEEVDILGKPLELIRRHIAGDVGGVDKTGIILAGFNPSSGNILVFEEADLNNPDINEIGEKISEFKTKEIHESIKAEETVIVVDVEPVSRNTLRNSHDLDLRKPSKQTKAKEDRIRLLRTLLREGRIKISSSCKKLIAQLEMGMWKETTSNTRDFERTADFGHLDLLDSLSYLVKSVDFRWNTSYNTKKAVLATMKGLS